MCLGVVWGEVNRWSFVCINRQKKWEDIMYQPENVGSWRSYLSVWLGLSVGESVKL